ncbi:MAG: dihydroorotate dehydrogenase electron transfer subunit [Candidatus Micrarchaeota archaeon]|nr:dihydroorotate dehydrogenase electron transfer subunit [Candidatus Micrarchaeota archaeon]
MLSPYKRFVIVRKKQETKNVSYISFDKNLKAKPGQFVMVWIDQGIEKPFSVANSKPFELAVAAIGPGSNALCEKKEGQEVFVRGPYGKGFDYVGKRWLVVGGGYGFAPLRFLIKEGLLKNKNLKVDCVIGAREGQYLMQPLEHKAVKTIFTTDDGSVGLKGTVLVAVEKLIKQNKYDCIYCAGPEKMMKAVALLAQEYKIPSQLSIERYYKCGFGICGHCSLNGWLSCYDGPTISGQKALALPDFGLFTKDKAGRKIKI